MRKTKSICLHFCTSPEFSRTAAERNRPALFADRPMRPTRLGSIVGVKRIEGPIFNKEAAEEHGLKICKDWIDERSGLDPPPTTRYRSVDGRVTLSWHIKEVEQ